jgi:Helicase associated domain
MSLNLFDLSCFPATPTATREALDSSSFSIGAAMPFGDDPFTPLGINEGVSLSKQFEKDHAHLLLGATTGHHTVLSPLTPRVTKSMPGNVLTDRSESSGGASVPSMCESSSYCSSIADANNNSRIAMMAGLMPRNGGGGFLSSSNHTNLYLSPIRQQAMRSMLLQDALAGRSGNMHATSSMMMTSTSAFDSPAAVSVCSSQQQQAFGFPPPPPVATSASSASSEGAFTSAVSQVPSSDFDESQSSQYRLAVQQHQQLQQLQQQQQRQQQHRAAATTQAEQEEVDSQRFKPFHEEKWSVRYKELLQFHQEHEHSAVPHTYPPNPQLARWVKRQRRQFKLRRDGRPSTMTPDRLELLKSVGFVWDSHDVNWREKLEALELFRKHQGHCNVPSNYTDKKLATWVKCQRRQYKLYWDGKPSAMSAERIMELEKRGFEWEIRAAAPRTPKDAPASASASASSAAQEQEQQQQQQQSIMTTSVTSSV